MPDWKSCTHFYNRGDQNSFRIRTQLLIVLGFSRMEVKNRGHLRVHARPTTRALRKSATGGNVEAWPDSHGRVVLARRYGQVGCDLRIVRRYHHAEYHGDFSES